LSGEKNEKTKDVHGQLRFYTILDTACVPNALVRIKQFFAVLAGEFIKPGADGFDACQD
jgi:hypothetical protein